MPVATDTLDTLATEYAGWCARNNLPSVSADEHDLELLSPDQREWIEAFIIRWDAVSAQVA
jgi:hypothetical protein